MAWLLQTLPSEHIDRAPLSVRCVSATAVGSASMSTTGSEPSVLGVDSITMWRAVMRCRVTSRPAMMSRPSPTGSTRCSVGRPDAAVSGMAATGR